MTTLISAPRGLAAVLAIAATALSGCGFESSFNKSWGTKFHDECVRGFAGQGGSSADAERFCTCVVNGLMPLSVADKMSLKPTSPKVQEVTNACLAQMQSPANSARTTVNGVVGAPANTAAPGE